MGQINIDFIFIGALAFFFRDITVKVAWSILIYLNRGEFNDDNNERTADRFDWHKPGSNIVVECYIVQYTITGVKWGFFKQEGFVLKKSYWLEWASWSRERFPVPIKLANSGRDDLVKLFQIKE